MLIMKNYSCYIILFHNIIFCDNFSEHKTCDSLNTLGPHGVFAYMFRSRKFDIWISLI